MSILRGVNYQRYNSPWDFGLTGQTWTDRRTGMIVQGHNQLDWPNPTPVTWYQSWTQSNFVGMLSQTLNPIPKNNYDWPNPQPVQWLQPWSWDQSIMIGQDILPHRQQDWPNPTQPYVTEKTIIFSHVGMTGLDVFPHRQQDWPNPTPVQWYQNWSQRPLEEQTVYPFRQQDWPNPTPVQWYQNWQWRQTGMRGQDLLPHNRSDWPNPPPVQWLQPFSISKNIATIIAASVPTHQYDWPNPQPITWNNFHYNSLLNTPFPPFTLPVRITKSTPFVRVPNSFSLWSRPGPGGRRYRIRSYVS